MRLGIFTCNMPYAWEGKNSPCSTDHGLSMNGVAPEWELSDCVVWSSVPIVSLAWGEMFCGRNNWRVLHDFGTDPGDDNMKMIHMKRFSRSGNVFTNRACMWDLTLSYTGTQNFSRNWTNLWELAKLHSFTMAKPIFSQFHIWMQQGESLDYEKWASENMTNRRTLPQPLCFQFCWTVESFFLSIWPLLSSVLYFKVDINHLCSKRGFSVAAPSRPRITGFIKCAMQAFISNQQW